MIVPPQERLKLLLPSDQRKGRKFSRSSAMRSKHQTHRSSWDNSFLLGRTTRSDALTSAPFTSSAHHAETTRYFLKIFSIDLPFANSSISLSK
jgi:hypothetical protein